MAHRAKIVRFLSDVFPWSDMANIHCKSNEHQLLAWSANETAPLSALRAASAGRVASYNTVLLMKPNVTQPISYSVRSP